MRLRRSPVFCRHQIYFVLGVHGGNMCNSNSSLQKLGVKTWVSGLLGMINDAHLIPRKSDVG